MVKRRKRGWQQYLLVPPLRLSGKKMLPPLAPSGMSFPARSGLPYRAFGIVCLIFLASTLILGGFVAAEFSQRRDPWHTASSKGVGDAVLSWISPPVERIRVEGYRLTDPHDVLKVLGVAKGMPIFAVDLERARARVEALPWIKQASIARELPDMIHLELLERQPMALWQKDDKVRLIDRRGHPVPIDDLEDYRTLPIVLGETAPEHAAALLRMIEEFPNLKDRLRVATRVARRRWTLHFSPAVRVLLPGDGINRALSKLQELQQQHAILDIGLERIDMRAPDRLYVDPGDTARFRRTNRVQGAVLPPDAPPR